MSFLGEIRRRKVFQVAAVYAVVAWLLVQIVATVEVPLNLPNWFDTVVIVALAIGYPIALILAWAFDLTPVGMVKDQGIVHSGGRRIEYALLALIVVAIGWLLYRTEITPSEGISSDLLPNSIAVLPFENLSPDPDNAYFALGIHDTILHELAKIADMNVIARTSVLPYGGGQTPIAQIAEELNVETIMEGTVQYAGDQVRITAQLIDPTTGSHLWSGNYDRPFADLFAIQSEIAERIALALEAELLPAERARIEKIPTNSPAAYALYLRALELFPGVEQAGISRSDEESALAYLDQATQIDAEFALAYAHKGKMQFLTDGNRLQNIERALALDRELGFGYLVLATLHTGQDDATAAQAAFERALQLTPNDPETLSQFGVLKSILGEHQNAITLTERAVSLDPNSWSAQYWVARMRLLDGDIVAAASAYRRTTELLPTNVAGHVLLGLTEAALGNSSEALDQFQIVEQLTNLRNNYQNAWLAYGYSQIGRAGDAQRVFNEYQRELTENPEAPPITNTFAHLAIGDTQAALDSLQELADGRSLEAPRLLYEVNAFNDPILDQPEFVEVRRRLGFRE